MDQHQHNQPCLIATHSDGAKSLAEAAGVRSVNLISNCNSRIEFTYKVGEGAAESLGVEVAARSGLSPEIVDRSVELRA